MFRWISILALPAEGVYTHLLFGTSLLGVASLLRVALEAQYVQYLSNTGVLLAHSQLVIHDGLSATNPLGGETPLRCRIFSAEHRPSSQQLHSSVDVEFGHG
jgi:hypothetical protein